MLNRSSGVPDLIFKAFYTTAHESKIVENSRE